MAAVLRAVSTAMPRGISTAEVARSTGLARPTVHRLLAALTAEGFCDHDNRAGLWMLGPEMYLMGTVAAERYDITDIARPHVAALADATGESAFLSVRRGEETVCLLRAGRVVSDPFVCALRGQAVPAGCGLGGAGDTFLPARKSHRTLPGRPRPGAKATAASTARSCCGAALPRPGNGAGR